MKKEPVNSKDISREILVSLKGDPAHRRMHPSNYGLIGTNHRHSVTEPISVKIQYPDHDRERIITKSEFNGRKYMGRIGQVAMELLIEYPEFDRAKITIDPFNKCFNIQLAGNIRYVVS